MKRYLGKKKRLKIYIDNQDKYKGSPLWEELLKRVKDEGLAGATVTKAVAGVGAFSQIHTQSLIALSDKLPLVVEIIDDEQKIEDFIKSVDEMIEEGLVTLDDVEVINYKKRGV